MRRDRDAGSATIWALIVVLVIWAGAGLAAVETLVIQTRHDAGAVADAVALAAASEGGLDPTAACAAASQVAVAHDALLVSCLLAGPVATVEISVAPAASLAWAGRVTARARAGPANTGVSNGTVPSRASS